MFFPRLFLGSEWWCAKGRLTSVGPHPILNTDVIAIRSGWIVQAHVWKEKRKKLIDPVLLCVSRIAAIVHEKNLFIYFFLIPESSCDPQK